MDIKRIFEKQPSWQAIVETSAKLNAAGFKVYLAGGSVRDALIGRTPHDFDLATSAKPEEVKALFPQALVIGQAFGVMILPFDGFQIEIATFRKDGEYHDGRRPESIEFSEPELDAQRRDFTINGLFYDLNSKAVIDYISGLADIEKKIIRAIGDPYARFKEDKLRMLRAARFSAQLDFEIEKNTLSAISSLCDEISQVSNERITEEFKKLACSLKPVRGFQVLQATGLLKSIFPSLGFFQTQHWEFFLRALPRLSHVASLEILVVCFALFECLSLKQGDINFQVNWSELPFVLSRDSKREIQFLIHGFFTLRDERDEGLLLLNEESGPLLTELCFVFADLGLFPKNATGELIDRFLSIADSNGHLPKAYLSGDDMLKAGVRPSPQMGELLKLSYMAQIKGEIKSKDEALAWVIAKL